jgi:hypothetical protein
LGNPSSQQLQTYTTFVSFSRLYSQAMPPYTREQTKVLNIIFNSAKHC